jgi:hypothetical protein
MLRRKTLRPGCCCLSRHTHLRCACIPPPSRPYAHGWWGSVCCRRRAGWSTQDGRAVRNTGRNPQRSSSAGGRYTRVVPFTAVHPRLRPADHRQRNAAPRDLAGHLPAAQRLPDARPLAAFAGYAPGGSTRTPSSSARPAWRSIGNAGPNTSGSNTRAAARPNASCPAWSTGSRRRARPDSGPRSHRAARARGSGGGSAAIESTLSWTPW